MITTAAHEVNEGRPPHLTPGPDQVRISISWSGSHPNGSAARSSRWSANGSSRARPGPGSATPRYWLPDLPRRGGHRRAQPRTSAAAQTRRAARRSATSSDWRPADPDPERLRIRPDERHDLLPSSMTTRMRKWSCSRPDDGQSVRHPTRETSDLKLAYAISVLQVTGLRDPGRESSSATAPARACSPAPPIYTGDTRARKMCVMVGDRPAPENGVPPRRQNRPPLLLPRPPASPAPLNHG